jgi:hypothetical protein
VAGLFCVHLRDVVVYWRDRRSGDSVWKGPWRCGRRPANDYRAGADDLDGCTNCGRPNLALPEKMLCTEAECCFVILDSGDRIA